MGEAMHGSGAPAQVLFGLPPLWVATLLFVGSYLVIMSDRVNRAIVALCGAAPVILVGVLNQDEALTAVDFNTIGLLLGMMLPLMLISIVISHVYLDLRYL